MSNHLELVRETAAVLGLLDEQGRLVRLESLSIMDLLNALEDATRLTIPTGTLRQESFETLETVAQLLDNLSSRQAST
jgi:acyl carrier protein